MCGARAVATTPTNRTPDDARAAARRKLEEATRGKFEFVRELGRGGMGTVYLAREPDLQRLVAIKALSTSWLADGSMVERFRREARVIASLRHPSIVHVHSVGQVDDIHFFVMDYIDGVSLGQIVRTHGSISISAIHAILYQVGSALSYAHRPARGVIHCDVKPSNVMVDSEGNAFVTDFGISKVTETTKSGLTLTGVIMGTPEYMSPEQCRGDAATFASDQYALGVVAYTLLTGSPPFTGPNYRVLTGHTSEPPEPIQTLRPDCPGVLSNAVHRMLAKMPANRWPDIKDALRAAGIGPVAPDDPVRDEIARLVATTRSLLPLREAGSRGSGGVSGVEARTPTALRILAIPASLETGDEVLLRAAACYEDGEEIENQQVTWESTDPSVARVDPTTGQLMAVGVGSTMITACTAGITQTLTVEVGPPQVVQLTVRPDWIEMEAGATAQLVAVPMGKHREALERRVQWSSNNPRTATVNEEGLVHAHQPGSASILAHCAGVAGGATVTVIPATVDSVLVRGVPEAMHVGQSTHLRAEVRDVRGDPLERSVYWSTSDASLAQVSETGELRAVAEGSVRIVAESGGQSASSTLKIVPVPVARILASPPPQELVVGDTFHLDASPRDAAGRPLSRTVSWTVDDADVVESLGGGQFRATGSGTTTVSVAAGEYSVRLRISVEPLRANNVILQLVPPVLDVDEHVNLEAIARDQRGRILERPIRWTSSNPWIARVSVDGVLTGIAPGHATVTGECDDARASFDVRVNAATWVTIVGRPGGSPPLEDQLATSMARQTGDAPEQQETAVEAGSEERVSTSEAEPPRRIPIWVFLAAAVAVAAGLWLLLRPNPPVERPPTPVALSLSTLAGDPVTTELPLLVGDTLTLVATPTDVNGNSVQGAQATWSSSDSRLATIDSNGTVVALAAGSLSLMAGVADLSIAVRVTVAEPAVEPETVTRSEAPPSERPVERTSEAPRQPADTVARETRQPDGELQLVIDPWAKVIIGQTPHGDQKRLKVPLPPGNHHIYLTNPELGTRVDTLISIKPGQPTVVRINMQGRKP